jgi:monofunctional biosynthetic peptidoglycan transglycosylase
VALVQQPPPTTAFIQDYLHRAQSEGLPPPDWRWVSYQQISPSVKRAVVAAEDLGFFSHRGFELGEVRAAVLDTLREGKPLRGASTITQQLAKNLWLSPKRSAWRKLEEAILVIQLERHLSKRRILEIYLNVVELGPGIYGVEAAAQRHFGRSAAELDEAEAAALAATLPRPGSWHPRSESRAYRLHVDRIRLRMERADWLRKLV